MQRGGNHTKALCVVAAELGKRAWRVMHRGEALHPRDVEGRAVSREEAAAIITERWTVPDEVRPRQRSRKTTKGKAPLQVLEGHMSWSA
jgi:hypothetical protein